MGKEKLYYVSAVRDVAMAIKVRAKNEPEALRKAVRGEWESYDYIVQHSYTEPYGFHVEGVCNEEKEDMEEDKERVMNNISWQDLINQKLLSCQDNLVDKTNELNDKLNQLTVRVNHLESNCYKDKEEENE